MKFVNSISLLILLIFLYWQVDQAGYYLGLNCKLCSDKISVDVRPAYNFSYPQSFYFVNNSNEEVLASGFKFGDSLPIKNIVAYEIYDNAVVVDTVSTKGTIIRYLIISSDKIELLKPNNFTNKNNLLKKINIDEEKIYWIDFLKKILLLSIFMIIFNVLLRKIIFRCRCYILSRD